MSTLKVDTIASDTTPTITISDGLSVTGVTTSTGNINISNDSGQIRIGAGADLKIFHNGARSKIENLTGDLRICGDAIQIKNYDDDETYITCANDGAVELYHNDVKKFETIADGIKTNDGNYMGFGNGNDLRLRHSSNVNFIESHNGEIHINKDTSENMAKFIPDGPVELYHNNVKKCATSSTGIDVSGGKIELLGNEGGEAQLVLAADEGDDNDDNWRFIAHVDNALDISNRASGSWEKNIRCVGNGTVELYHDNVKQFETNSVGAKIKTTGANTRLTIEAPEGGDAEFHMYADDGDDNNDQWRMVAGAGAWYMSTYGGGSWNNAIRLNSDGYLHIDMAGQYTGLANNAHGFRTTYSNWTLYAESSHASQNYGYLAYFNSSHPDDRTSRFFQATDDQTSRFIVYSDGDVENHDNSYGATSDVKLKENIVDAKSQWDDIKAVKVRNYNFKISPDKKQIGIVAQELETISPGLVQDNPDLDIDNNDLGTTTKSVKYSILYMKAIKALQEAMAKIETLETKVAALESA